MKVVYLHGCANNYFEVFVRCWEVGEGGCTPLLTHKHPLSHQLFMGGGVTEIGGIYPFLGKGIVDFLYLNKHLCFCV